MRIIEIIEILEIVTDGKKREKPEEQEKRKKRKKTEKQENYLKKQRILYLSCNEMKKINLITLDHFSCAPPWTWTKSKKYIFF